MTKVFEVMNSTASSVELWIYSGLGEWEVLGDVTAGAINKELSAHRGKDITLRINSYGGVVTTAMAIYSGLKRHDGKVHVFVDGIAASAASFIAMAGDTITIPRNALFMIHNPWTYAYGEAEDLRKQADRLEKMRDQMVDIYAERSGLEREKIVELLDAETWLTGEEAVELGFADTTTDEDIEAYATASQLVFAGHQFQRDKMNLPEKLVAKLETREPSRAPTPTEETMPKNIAELTEKFPELIEEVKSQAAAEAKASVQSLVDEARAEAVAAERKRIKEIEEIANVGYGDLVAKAKFETGASAQDLAYEIMKAQAAKGGAFLESRAQDAVVLDGVGGTPAPSHDSETDARQAELAKAAAKVSELNKRGLR